VENCYEPARTSNRNSESSPMSPAGALLQGEMIASRLTFLVG